MQYGVHIVATQTITLTTLVAAGSAEEAKAKVQAAIEQRTESATEVTALEIDGKIVPVEYVDFVDDDFEIGDAWEAAEVFA
jgi:hypothetical protein